MAKGCIAVPGAVTHKGLKLLCHGDCRASATPWHEKTNVPLKKHQYHE